MTSANLA